MTTATGPAWDLAGRLVLQVGGLDRPQARAVEQALDPFLPSATAGPPDVRLIGAGPLPPDRVVEVHGPARDGTTTASDRHGRLLVRYGGRWATVPEVGPHRADAPLDITVEPGLPLASCWADLVRPAMHCGLHRHDGVAVHAAAVETDGQGLLVGGWSETGKTEVALALVERGARFLSDKWTVAGPDGCASAFPVPVGVRGWALDALPVLRSSMTPAGRVRLATSGRLKRATEGLGHGRGGGLVGHGLRRAAELGDRVGRRPSEVRAAYADTGDPARHVPLRTLLVLTTSATDDVDVQAVDPAWAARRLARSAAYERRAFFDLQERGAYAGLSDRAGAREWSCRREEDLLLQSLLAAGTTVLRVGCPFPGDPRRVVDSLDGLAVRA